MEQASYRMANNPKTLCVGVGALLMIYFVARIVHRIYFDKLSHIPGPKINALSRIPYARHALAGTTVENVQALHDKYGDVVRVSPNEVSFTSGDTAWQDIYGFRTGKLKGHVNMQKDPAWYAPPPKAPNIIVANDEDHTRFRKVLSHAFSDKALANQESLLQQYVDLLIIRLRENAAKDQGPLDMAMWYNAATFDVIADLMFGEPFGNLRDGRMHEFIPIVLNSILSFRLYYIFHYWPFLKNLRTLVADKTIVEGRVNFYKWVAGQTRKRTDRETQRPDFVTEIMKHNGEKGGSISPDELASNASVFLLAGSETTATLLSGVTYLLLKNPTVLQKLKDEVRGKWKTYDEITLEQVNNTPYLIAVLQEALRYFPPVPTGFERQVGKGGEFVSGHWIPEGTAVCVSSWPTAHSERNFKDAESFVPERWLGDPRYADDKKTSISPFSFGPRNCLGKNLAYAEMRLILAKVIWTFDLRLDASCEDWMKRCRVMVLWEKPPLEVHLTEVVRE